MQFITIIDHLAGSKVPYTYIINNGKTKLEAVACAMAAAYKFLPYYRVMVAKCASKKEKKYLPILEIYKDGSVGDLVKNNWYGWGDVRDMHHLISNRVLQEP